MADFDPVEFARSEDFEEDVPYEERLAVGLRIQRGIEDADEGRLYTMEEVRRWMANRATKYSLQTPR